ncbi:NAD(P)-dependent oxidoreductase [Kineococcus sp. SYSU DK002]|uniref:NAD(P)-dependent oxidoreductase n=1 Tax=Kineococcus sp. SYSU DK002 TaxID=3383123 RepID=UPI003D7E5605
MERIGFVGLGTMGRPMAANLVGAGYRVRALCRHEEHREAARGIGATPVDTVAELTDGVEAVLSIVPDSPDVLDLALGEDGLLAAMPAGSLFVDLSSIRPDAARAVHAAAADRGVECLDAPVSGGEAGAVEGTLAVMVGGSQAAFDRALPVLRAVGTTIIRVGDAGAGQVVKAANQLVVAGNLQVLGEAVAFLEAHSADLPAALDVIGAGLAGSTVLTRKRAGILAGDYQPGFRVALHHKDLGIVGEAARANSLSLPVTGVVSALLARLNRGGSGGLDHSALVGQAREVNS